MSYYAPDYSRPKWQAPVEIGKEFHFHDGPRVASLAQMGEAIRTVPDAVLRYHTGTSHDIAAWIAHAVGNESLASAMRDASTRMELVIALEQHMALVPDTPWYVASYWLREPVFEEFNAHGTSLASMKQMAQWLGDVRDTELDRYWLTSPNALSTWLTSVVGDYVLADELEQHVPTSRVLKLVFERRIAQLERYAAQRC